MFFLASKVFWLILDPINIIFFGTAISCLLMWFNRPHLARIILSCLIVIWAAIVIGKLGILLLHPLETKYSNRIELPGRVDGIILLGGAQEPSMTEYRHQAAINDAAETMTTFLALAKRHPEAVLVFSGGSGNLFNQVNSERKTVELFMLDQMFSRKIVYEDKSKNTYENALFAKELVNPKSGEKWLLVTSARRMPRALAVFEHIGWPMIPVSCDFSAGPYVFNFDLSDIQGQTHLFAMGLREWLGLIAYDIAGKIDGIPFSKK